ncbi:hypothetical protein ACA081_00210 [Candidatus Hodgkinia cicadicola]
MPCGRSRCPAINLITLPQCSSDGAVSSEWHAADQSPSSIDLLRF